MEEQFLKNVKFNIINIPIQIFCDQLYKGYYIRGQINEVSDLIYDKKLEDEVGNAFYHLKTLALVNDKYQKGFKKSGEIFYPEFGSFIFNTKEEFLNALDTQDLESAKYRRDNISIYSNKPLQEILEELKELRNPVLTISLNDAGIIENTYLKDSIEAKKEIILLNMAIHLDRIESLKGGLSTDDLDNYPKRIYSLIANYFSEDSIYDEKFEFTWHEDLFETLYFNFDYNYLEKKEYYQIMNCIGYLGNLWIKRKKISNSYIKALNQFNKNIGDRTYPFNDYCFKFYDDLIDDLLVQKQIKKCQFCGSIFRYKQGKKYCSLQSEGKDCAKKARNKKYYAKKKKELREKSRKEMRETRVEYKKHGLKY